ncbi:MAG: DsrE family protein [Woeseiaceae bacterium]
MLKRVFLLVVPLCWCSSVWAGEPALGPVIKDYGPTYLIEDRDVALEDGFVYKAVFDIAAYRGEVTSLNAELVSVARFLNMHARNGTPPGDMDLAIVVHGAALRNLLTHNAYRKRHDIDNPNLDLLIDLHDAGVRIMVCGQSMAFGGIERSELASRVEVGLSAMTLLTVLQSEGYALLP